MKVKKLRQTHFSAPLNVTSHLLDIFGLTFFALSSHLINMLTDLGFSVEK